MANKSKILHVRVNEQDAQRWQEEARSRGLNLSMLSRQVINSFLSGIRHGEINKLVLTSGTDTNKIVENNAKIVKIRLTENEFEALSAKADSYGMSKQQCLIRLIRSFLTHSEMVSQSEIEAISNYVQEIRKVGINLNQIAKRINQAASIEVPASLIETALITIGEIKKILDTSEAEVESFLSKNRSRGTIAKIPQTSEDK